MRPQFFMAILATLAIFFGMDDYLLIQNGESVEMPYYWSVVLGMFPVAWSINQRRESLKRLGAKLFTSFWAGMFTVATYFFLLSDMAGASMMHDRISPLPRYVLPAILAVLPAICAVSYLRKSFAEVYKA